ncbi:DUF2397 family protein [Allosalinactinospora lopnorensis]|uniref:DUF2397 family protein n=1 Tax=Allosalinactinospora lopnorensis TaxID=1352348 RepID=UPI000695E376|nr:DUF2397 family protein [Allosalinactinospora lopnorensis]
MPTPAGDAPVAGEVGRPVPRHGRSALLRLACWFEAADTATAHEIYTAAFAAYRARHLGGQAAGTVTSIASWWNAPLAHTAAAKLTGALPAAPAQDHGDQRARLRDAAESSAHWRRSAAQEVRRLLADPTGDDSRLHLSSPALEVLMELLTAALGSGDATRGAVSAGDLELDIRLHAQRAPGASVTLRGAGGELTMEGLRLRATSYTTHTVEEGESAGDSGRAAGTTASLVHPA